MTDASVILKPGKERILFQGHPWLFSGAVARADRSAQPGAVVTVISWSGQPLGRAFYNVHSDIALRMISLRPQDIIDHAFWRARIQNAIELRSRVVPEGTTAYRVIHAEGDGMPGFIADRYGDFLVTSFTTAGMEIWRESVHASLLSAFTPRGIYERSEGRSRHREGLSERCENVWGNQPPESIEIIEHGARFKVNILQGQKTGFFLDQRENRLLLSRYCKGASVLNCFAYSGGFSVYAARAGAAQVMSVDISASANELCQENLAMNGFSIAQHPVVTADVFDFLRNHDAFYDVIILDPPAFAKSQKDIMAAARGYKDINLQAMKRLKPGGLLATFSCSNHVDADLFRKIVGAAAADAGKSARLLSEMGAGPDHPVILAHGEGRYLKGLLLSIN